MHREIGGLTAKRHGGTTAIGNHRGQVGAAMAGGIESNIKLSERFGHFVDELAPKLLDDLCRTATRFGHARVRLEFDVVEIGPQCSRAPVIVTIAFVSGPSFATGETIAAAVARRARFGETARR